MPFAVARSALEVKIRQGFAALPLCSTIGCASNVQNGVSSKLSSKLSSAPTSAGFRPTVCADDEGI